MTAAGSSARCSTSIRPTASSLRLSRRSRAASSLALLRLVRSQPRRAHSDATRHADLAQPCESAVPVVPVVLLSCSPGAPLGSRQRGQRASGAALMTCGGLPTDYDVARLPASTAPTNGAWPSVNATRTASSTPRRRARVRRRRGRRRGLRADARPRLTAATSASSQGIAPAAKGVSACPPYPADARQGDDALVVLPLGRLSYLLVNPESPDYAERWPIRLTRPGARYERLGAEASRVRALCGVGG